MPKLPRTSARNIFRTLEKMKFFPVRQKGSHVLFRCEDRNCIIPNHEEVAVGTLRRALRQAEISPEEFMEYFAE